MRGIKFSYSYFLCTLALALAGCGGGGSGAGGSPPSGGGDEPPPPSEFTATPQQLRERVAIDSPRAEITLENTPLLSGTFHEFYQLAEELYYTYLDYYAWGFNPLEVENGIFECRYGGHMEMRYSRGDTVLSAFYSDCVDNLPGIEGRVTLSGAERQSFLRDESGERYMRHEYDGYRIAADIGTLSIDGVTELFDSSVDGRPGDVLLDLSIGDGNGAGIRAENLWFDLYRDKYGVYFHNVIEQVSGTIEFTHGSVEVTNSGVEPVELRFTGATDAGASMLVAGSYPSGTYMLLGFDGDADGYRDNTLYAALDEYLEEPFAKGGTATPLLRGTSLDPEEDVAQLGHSRAAFDVAPLFRDPGGNLLGYTLELVKVEEVQGEELSGPREEIEPPVEYQLEQGHAGSYVLSSGVQRLLVIYSFHVTARNAHGEGTTEPLLVEVPVYLDLDDDGAPDPSDGDMDGDGVPNHKDLWPRDPAEWEDTDGDGIGNNADEDDDGDEVADADDAQPLDFLCSIESDTDGETCLHRMVLPNSNAEYWNAVSGRSALTYYRNRPWTDPWGVSLGEDGVLYFWNATSPEVHRWDSDTGHFLEPVSFNRAPFEDGLWGVDNRLVNAPLQNAAYVFYDSLRGTNGVTKIALGSVFEESLFLSSEQVDALGLEDLWWLSMEDHTESALVFKEVRSRLRDYIAVGSGGDVLDRHTSEVPEEYAGEEYDITFRPHHVGPFCTYGFYFDEETATFVDNGSGDPLADPCARTFLETGIWPAVSADGQLALTSKGVIDRFQNILVETPGISPEKATWVGEHLYHLDGETSRIVRYSSAGEPLGQMLIPATDYIHNLLGTGEHLVYFGINQEDGHVLLLRYRE